jgi:hypothetical protein
MTLEEIKTAVQALPKEDRRKLGVYILELEKDYFQKTVGPQIVDDLDAVSKVVQETIEKMKRKMKESL